MAEQVAATSLPRALWGVIASRHDRLVLAKLAVVMLVGAALEVVGIGAVIPFIYLLGDPSALSDIGFLAPTLGALGIEDGTRALLAAGGALVAIFAIKSAYLAWMWNTVFRYLFDKTATISHEILRGYVEGPYERYLEHDQSALIRNATVEPDRVTSGLVLPALRLLTELVVVAGVVLLLGLVEGWVILAGLLVMAVLGWGIAARLKARLRDTAQERIDRDAHRIEVLRRSVGGLKELRVLGREAHHLNEFRLSTSAVYDAYRFKSLTQIVPRMIIEAVAVSLLVALVVVLLLLGRGTEGAFGGVAVVAVAMIRLVPSINRIVAATNQVRFNLPSIAVVAAELDAGELIAEKSHSSSPAPLLLNDELRLDRVSFTYPNAEGPALEDVSLSVPQGSCVGIIGLSGAGKTTLLDLMLGLLVPSRGAVLVDGWDIRDDLDGWRRQIGYISQNTYIANDSVRRNVAFGLPDEEIDDEAVWRALRAARIDLRVRSQDEGLDAQLGEGGLRFSGGERQRLGIARALYHRPTVLVMDEATSALDSATEQEITRSIQEFKGDHTVIIVSHRPTTIQDCDIVFVIDGGRLARSGSPDEMLRAQDSGESDDLAVNDVHSRATVELA